MDKPVCEAKVRELSQNLAESLVEKAMRLYRSGGVDVSDFRNDDYRLPKALVAAVIDDCRDEYTPRDPELRKLAENLKRI